MPEGPEIQSIVTDLKKLIIGRQILDLVTNNYTRRLFGKADIDVIRRQIRGATIINVTRIGKNIVIRLINNIYLVVHLRMTGQIFLRKEIPKFCRLTIKLDQEDNLYLADMRTFATCEIFNADEMLDFEKKKKIGVDALSPAFSINDLKQALRSKRKISVILLDQAKISGLGNIYVNESLFLAKIHPLRKANSLSNNEIQRLYKAIKTVLTKAIKHHGTTFSDYRLPGGEMGSYQKHLNVFRRKGKACKKCRTEIRREKLSGRSVFYCPKCQNFNSLN